MGSFPGSPESLALAHRLQAAGSVDAALGLGCSVVCGVLFPQSGVKPVCPPLKVRFLTTGLSEKSLEC